MGRTSLTNSGHDEREQHERQCEFDGEKRGRPTSSRYAGIRCAPRVLDDLVDVETQEMDGGREPEHQHTDGAHHCEYDEHAAVDCEGHPVLERACRDHGGQPSKTRHGDDEPGSDTKHREQRALEEQLPQEASARRPNR